MFPPWPVLVPPVGLVFPPVDVLGVVLPVLFDFPFELLWLLSTAFPMPVFEIPPAVADIELPIELLILAIDCAREDIATTFVNMPTVFDTTVDVILFTKVVVTDWQGELEFC